MSMLSGSLPNGAQLNLANGQLTGTPTESGTFRMTIKIVDGAGRESYQLFTLRIDPITITTASLPTAYEGVNYNGLLAATGIGPITWSLVGSSTLPPGLVLHAGTGIIDGAPTVNCCYYSFTVRATDGVGQTTQKTLAISVQQALTISTNSLWDGTAGSTYGGGLFAFGGLQPYTWSMSGGPIGLAIDPSSGQFLNSYPENVLRQAGSFTIAAHVTDASAVQQQASRNIALNVYAQDQAGASFGNLPDINFNAGRKIAQVYRTGTPYGVSGIQIWNIQCDAGVTLFGKVFPVTEIDMPNDAGVPMRSASLTSNQFGFFDSNNLIFSPPVSMDQATKFSIVFSTSGHCVVKDWPENDYYQWGDAWVHDGGGWGLASENPLVERADLPLTTLITPSPSLRFLAGWRGGHASALLNDGRIFLAGSDHRTEVYDPATNNLTLTADMNHARQEATATVVNGGKVLVAGGNFWNGNETVSAATTQLFNPGTGQFEASQNMSVGRIKHTATRLNNGRVLITGGQSLVDNTWITRQSADLFDGNGNFIATLNMTMARAEHTATLLSNGKVLIVGGWTNGPGAVAEIYDPSAGANGSFSASAAEMPGFAWPTQHTATLLTTGPHAGEVLIAGGYGNPTLGASYFYNPGTDTFANAPALLTRRLDHTATRLPNGRIVFAGGVVDTSIWSTTSLVEMYDPETDEQTEIGYLIAERNTHSADVVSTPNGLKLAVAAGYGHSAITGITIEQFDLADQVGMFAASTPMTTARRSHVMVQLNSGTVLLAGSDAFGTTSAEIYDPATGNTAATGSLNQARCYGCFAVKLNNGKVLVGGGWNGGPVLNTAELYDPATGQFSLTGSLTANRLGASAVLLNNGKVLVLGGHNGFSPYSSAELYDPALGTFSATGSMSVARNGAAVVKLLDGRVLVAGGQTPVGFSNTAEIYDPITGQFSATNNMITARQVEGALLLNDGRVLIAGGYNGSVMAAAEVYNPISGTFTSVGSMTTPRSGHVVVKLLSGQVLVANGLNASNTPLNTAELFDPVTNVFTQIGNTAQTRVDPKAILLQDGRVMISGGTSSGNNYIASVEFYTP